MMQGAGAQEGCLECPSGQSQSCRSAVLFGEYCTLARMAPAHPPMPRFTTHALAYLVVITPH